MDADTAVVLEDIRKILAQSDRLHSKKKKPKHQPAHPLAFVDPSIKQYLDRKKKKKKEKKQDKNAKVIDKENQAVLLSPLVDESKNDEAAIRSIALPFIESSLLVTQSMEVAERFAQKKNVEVNTEQASTDSLRAMLRRYPRFSAGLSPPSENINDYRIRNDQWLARMIEECYDVVSSECCKQVSVMRQRRRFELDLGAMDAFPLVVRRHIKHLYSTLEIDSQICIELLIAVDRSLKISEQVSIHRKDDSRQVSSSGRVELFSSFLAEEFEVDRLAVYLHVRDFVQDHVGVKFRDLYVTLQNEVADSDLPSHEENLIRPDKKRKKGGKSGGKPLKTTTLFQNDLFLDPVVFEGDLNDIMGRENRGGEVSPVEGKVVPPSVQIPFFLRMSKDACLPEAPLLALDMRTLKVICQTLTPNCSEKIRDYMIKRCLFWTDVLRQFKGSTFKLWQMLRSSSSFYKSNYEGLTVKNLKVVPAHVLLWMVCTEISSYTDGTEHVAATDTTVSDETTTEQSIAMLNNVYYNDRAREKDMDEEIRIEEINLSQCNAHITKLRKRKRAVERKRKEYNPDFTLTGLKAKQAEANKGYDIVDISNIEAEIVEYEGEKSALEAKIKRLKKNKQHLLQDITELWDVALKGKRKFQGLNPLESKSIHPMKGNNNNQWRHVVIDKIIHSMKRSIQLSQVECEAEKSIAETLSKSSSISSLDSVQETPLNDDDYDAMLQHFDEHLQGKESSTAPASDIADLIRDLENNAKDLASMGKTEDGPELLYSAADTHTVIIDPSSHFDGTEEVVDTVSRDELVDENSVRCGLDEQKEGDLDARRRLVVSREAECFVGGILFERTERAAERALLVKESEVKVMDDVKLEDIDGREKAISVEECEDKVIGVVVDSKESIGDVSHDDMDAQRVVNSPSIDTLLEDELLGLEKEQIARMSKRIVEESFDCALRGLELEDGDNVLIALSRCLQRWKSHHNLRVRRKRLGGNGVREVSLRRVLSQLQEGRKRAVQRSKRKMTIWQSSNYLRFLKEQRCCKAALLSFSNRATFAKDSRQRQLIWREKIQSLQASRCRAALQAMLDQVERQRTSSYHMKRARKWWNSKMFEKKRNCLAEWLYWTNETLQCKNTAAVKIQLCARCFLARRDLQKRRQAARLRENMMMECMELGRKRLLKRALKTYVSWKRKSCRLRQCQRQVLLSRVKPLVHEWVRACAASKVTRVAKGYLGRERARSRRIRAIRTEELVVGLPIICHIHAQSRALLFWRQICACKIVFRVSVRLSVVTAVFSAFGHWKNMSLEYTDYLNAKATVILSMARMFLSKKNKMDFPTVRHGVLKFQCAVRGRLAQQTVAMLRARMYAANCIQKLYRGYSCRKGLRQKRIDDIHIAAANNNYGRLLFYCEKYFNLTFQPDAQGNHALHNAAKFASKRCLKLLIKFHHDPTLVNSEGYTPLHLLIMSSSIHRDSMFEYMLEIGFDEEQYTPDGKSALCLACEYGRSRIANLCLEHGLDPNQPDSHNATCLQYAILGEFVPLVRTLLRYEADVNQVGFEGMYPLHDVANVGNLEIAQILIEEFPLDIDINVQDQTYGWTPLMLAARNGFDEVVGLLATKIAAVDVIDYANWTVAHHSGLANNGNTINHLRELVADFDAIDANGNTPMHVAAEHGSYHSLREMLSLGAMPSPQNFEGNQPAHLAAKNNHVSCLNLLVRYDEHIGRVNFQHQTPLGVAKFYMAEESRRFLEEWFTKVAGPEKRNKLGDIWWDQELDEEVGDWTVTTDEANHRVFVNTQTGEVSLDPPKLTYDHVSRVAENAQADMQMKVIKNEGENTANYHVYLEEHEKVKKEIERDIKLYDAATIITKSARRKLAYILFIEKKVAARRRKVLTNFFMLATRVLAIRRMLKNTLMWRRVQALWRGYIMRCHFYYWDGMYESMWYERARRRLATVVWRAYKNFRLRRLQHTLHVAASAPKMLDEWEDLLEGLGHPYRVVGVIEEYLYPGTSNIYFYRNTVTGNISFEKPKEIAEKDLQKHRDRMMIMEQGFTKNQVILARRLQAMWRGYKVRFRFRLIIRAKAICTTAEKKFLREPDNEQHLFNYVLYLQVVKNDYDRARPLYVELLRKMTHRGPDIAQILYAYAIFAFVVHDQEFEECISLVERGKAAEEKQYNYLRRQKLKGVDMRGYENYKDIEVSRGSCFELASIGFFQHAATQNPTSEVLHNYAACTFLVYRDFEKAFETFLRSFQLDPFNVKCRKNYDSMMTFVCGNDPERISQVAGERMQALSNRDHQRQMQLENARAEAFKREKCATRIQRWYSHHKGLREYYKLVDKLRRKKKRAKLLK